MRTTVVVVVAALAGCGTGPDDRPADAGTDVDCDPFAVDVVSFSPGRNAGFGAEAMPAVVLGPPEAGEAGSGSTDVVSLGVGGVIVLELGCAAVDGDGVDLVVYENAFAFEKSEGVFASFAEAGEVAVSADGVDFVTFACDAPTGSALGGADDDGIDGCAGMAAVQATADNELGGVFPEGGGDGFDLESIGVDEARFVRITDRAPGGAGTSAGFDLDAVGTIVHGL